MLRARSEEFAVKSNGTDGTLYSHYPGAGTSEEARPVVLWGASGIMPPPTMPMRRPSVILPDPHSPLGLKSEVINLVFIYSK